MITKIFEIITKTGKAEKDIENLSSEVETLNTGLEKTNSEVGGLKKGGKAFDTLKKGAKGVAGGFKMMGTALKAAGIGLALAAFGLLKQLFEENQKVVDTFNIAFEGLSIAFNDFFNFISSNIGAVTGFFKSIFDDPLGSVKALGQAIKDNIIERVKSALEVFGFLGKAMKKLFAGDFKGAIEEVNNAGAEFVDVLTGVDNSVEKATEVIEKGVTAITEYTKSTVEAATANVELKKQAELAAVANQGLIEKYDLQAESLRQIRDDERKSIEDRKKANDELAVILEKQEKAMKVNANTQLQLAEVQLKKDAENVEALKAKEEALNELAAIEATVTGFRSEQLTNEAALEKEGLELINSRLESEANLSIEQKRFNAEQIEDELERLQVLKNIDAEEKDLQLKRLQDVINTANDGTQAKVDAEIAYNETKQELEQQEVLRAKEIADAKAVISKQITDDELANDEKQKQSDKDKAQQKIDNQNAILDATNSALSSIGQIADAFAGDDEERAKKAFNINKGLGIAQAIISTSQGIMNAYTNPVDVASGVAFAKSIAIGLAGAAQIATIATTQFQPSGGGGSTSPSTSTEGGATTSPSQAPSFNVVGQSQANQVSMALANQQPTQAFVVSGDVTTAQQLQNNTITQATF
jgi:hypothetical protein